MDWVLEPGEPEFLTAEAECWAGLLELEALVDSTPVATNLVVEIADEDGNPVDVAFPVNDLTQADERVTRWQGEIVHDCETPLVLTWTAYTGQQTETEKVTAWPMVPPEVDGAVPPWGSDAGGSTVTLLGAWMEDVTAVFFGDQAATVLSADTDGVVVQTPAHAAGLVDVVIQTPSGETTMDDAFTYYTDQSGLARGFARPIVFRYDTSWFTIGSPYAQLGAYGPFVQVDMAMVEPIDVEETYVGAYPKPGECEWGDYAYEPYAIGSYMLMDDGDAYALTLVTDWLYALVIDQVDPLNWANATFDLEVPTGDDTVPAQTLNDAIGFAPFPAHSADWQTENPHVRDTDLTLSWTDEPDLAAVRYVAYLVEPGMQTLNQTSCTAAAEDGSIVVPWDSLTEGVDSDQANGVVIKWEFQRETTTVFPHDNSVFFTRGIAEEWTWHPLVSGE